jgi:signal transduction histidine kinase
MYGALLGALFLLVATLVRILSKNDELSWTAVRLTQRDPVFWLLDLTPALTTLAGLIVGTLRDDLSLRTAELAAAHHDMRVATRALEETAQQSKERQAELDRARNDLDRFARVASHDLRAPLHAINSLAEWVREDLGSHLTRDGHDHLALMQRRAHTMESLLSALQAYTLAGREMGAAQPVDLKVLAHHVLREIPGGSRFIMSYDGSEEPLHTCRTSLYSVLRVLLENCVVHHDMAPGRIFLERRDVGPFVEIVVADDGPGIDARYHDKVFGLFVTLHRRDERNTTGAGLAVAKRVVETVGGQIAILPQEGRGTRVRFTWPKSQTAEKQSADVLARLSLKTLSAKKDGPPSSRGH